jgi:hypothetical protein
MRVLANATGVTVDKFTWSKFMAANSLRFPPRRGRAVDAMFPGPPNSS